MAKVLPYDALRFEARLLCVIDVLCHCLKALSQWITNFELALAQKGLIVSHNKGSHRSCEPLQVSNGLKIKMCQVTLPYKGNLFNSILPSGQVILGHSWK